MAIGTVSFIRKDGNLPPTSVGNDHISGLIFDLPGLGITEFEQEKNNFFYGIPYFHISEFFRMKPDGSLYVMFADCSKNWNAIKTIQSVANGDIKQLGIWTPQNIWSTASSSEDDYSLNLVSDINTVAEELANEHRPLSVLLTGSQNHRPQKDPVLHRRFPACDSVVRSR